MKKVNTEKGSVWQVGKKLRNYAKNLPIKIRIEEKYLYPKQNWIATIIERTHKQHINKG